MRVKQIARALTLSVALAVIGLIAATPASAAEDVPKVESRVKIKRVKTLNFFHFRVEGVVRSPEKACERDRLVRLHPVRRDRRSAAGLDRPHVPGGPRREHRRTNRRGEFQANLGDAPTGAWRVKIESWFPGEDRSLKCKAAKSRFILINP